MTKIVPFVMLALFVAVSTSSYLETVFRSFAMAMGN